MKSLKWLLEIVYYEKNYKAEETGDWKHDFFPSLLCFLIAIMMPFVAPFMNVFWGYDATRIVFICIVYPILALCFYLYFRTHHDEIMNNEEYIYVNNRRKIYFRIIIVSVIGGLLLLLLNNYLLEKLLLS